ncbi:TIGR02301 family protein [Agrobacterium larrymoorei]|uniref:TIGR02301 family protein n=1 Tax=Agrobacterium larrymoorei TaxID=160699 RepID=UPI0015720BA2|nr:TIGR02301 family protein [Agrobacterium larrymoorei]NTJ41991.1 TIGR02301 family protein [Agrobacterium larrymoorei]
MGQRVGLLPTVVVCAVLPFAAPAVAQPKVIQAQPPAQTQENKPAPYDDKLARLSEILGAVQYLRTLCPATGTEEWRKSMSNLLAADTATEPHRRQRMTAAFNRGYRTFAAVHTSCTPAAISAEEKYRNEGATLAQEIASRFGN